MKKILIVCILYFNLIPCFEKGDVRVLGPTHANAQIYGQEWDFENPEDCYRTAQNWFNESIDDYRSDLMFCLFSVASSVATNWIDFLTHGPSPTTLTDAVNLILTDLPEAYECINDSEQTYFTNMDVTAELFEDCPLFNN